MESIWVVLKIAVYFLILKTVIQFSHAILFITAKRPIGWIAFMGTFAALNMALAYWCDWNPRITSAATILAVVFNTKLKNPPVISGASIDWPVWGISNAKRKTLYGLTAFGLISLVFYVFFYAEISRA